MKHSGKLDIEKCDKQNNYIDSCLNYVPKYEFVVMVQ